VELEYPERELAEFDPYGEASRNVEVFIKRVNTLRFSYSTPVPYSEVEGKHLKLVQ
jgi:hypothetical protein